MKIPIQFLYVVVTLFIFSSCQFGEKELPILGNPKIVNGEKVPHQIPEFSFINQNGDTISNENYKDKIYVSNFFFTTCPTICPTTSRQMLRIYDKYENDDRIQLLSHTLDPKRDTIQALFNYANNLEVEAPKWNFVTGTKSELHGIVDEYFNIVIEDESAPGGINHSGKIVLVDQNGHIRSFCEGTDPNDVDRFLDDIDILLESYE